MSDQSKQTKHNSLGSGGSVA